MIIYLSILEFYIIIGMVITIQIPMILSIIRVFSEVIAQVPEVLKN